MEETKTKGTTIEAIALTSNEYTDLIKAQTQLDLIKTWVENADACFVPDALRIILGTGSAEQKLTTETEEQK